MSTTTLERFDHEIRCDRCGRITRWLGDSEFFTCPAGWWLVMPRLGLPLDTSDCAALEMDPAYWVCDACLTGADDEAPSYAIEMGSEAGAPLIELLDDGK